MARFVQLSTDETEYLLDLIEDIDSQTPYTLRQREYTVPKLERILNAPTEVKLAFQDVDYLIDLILDDDLPELLELRHRTLCTLVEIKKLQSRKWAKSQEVELQRLERRARRTPFASQSRV